MIVNLIIMKLLNTLLILLLSFSSLSLSDKNYVFGWSQIEDIKQRDLSDSTREISPLLPADDAHIIDSSDMSIEDVFSYAENLIRKEFI